MDNEVSKLISDNESDLYAVTDLEGTYLEVSDSHTLLGYAPEELLGKNAFSFIHPDDFPMIQFVLERAPEQKIIRFRYLQKDGTYIHFETRGYIIRDGQGTPEKYLFFSMIDPVS